MDRFRQRLILPLSVLALFGMAVPCFAQFDAGVGVGPDAGLLEKVQSSVEKDLGVTRMALAMSLVLDSATWVSVGLSTGTTASELTKLMRQGHYRLELLQLALLADRSGRKLVELTAKRASGKTMREIAESLSISFSPIYDESIEMGRRVEARMEAVSRVRTGE